MVRLSLQWRRGLFMIDQKAFVDLGYAERGKEMLSYGSRWRSGLRLGLGFNCLSLFSCLGFSSSGGQCGEQWSCGLNRLGLGLNRLQAMGILAWVESVQRQGILAQVLMVWLGFQLVLRFNSVDQQLILLVDFGISMVAKFQLQVAVGNTGCCGGAAVMG